ncbi:MAG: hypothetical protein KC432_06245 [Thermomicrobiales bacterium]|nr:hypothetical protein [Thermomicrobiales bacterium]
MRTRFTVLVTLLLLGFWSAQAVAQNEPGLPPGILSIEVDGKPINSLTSPVTSSSTPEISGRTDESVETLELVIASADVTRFPARIGGSGRFRAVPPGELPDATYSLYANDALVGSFSIVGGTPGPRSPGALLDIARVVPYPADAAASLPTLAFLEGRFYNLTEEAARTADRNPAGPPARVLERQLATAGWLQRYENRLAVPSTDNPRTFALQVSSFVVEYASGADARAAFDSLNESDVVDFPTIGDESRVVFLNGVTPDTGAAYQAARLAFRVGPLLVVIFYADLANQPPDLAVLESIGLAVADRGRAVADRQVVPLGSMALRLDLNEAEAGVSTRALYEIRAGALTAVFGEPDDARASRAALLGGTTDAFTSSTLGRFSRTESNRGERQADSTPGAGSARAAASPIAGLSPATVSLRSSLYSFTSEADANAWMTAKEASTLESSNEHTRFERVSDAPALADAATVFTMVSNGGSEPELSGYRFFARSGLIVVVVDIQSAPTVSLRGAVGLVEEQLACIEAQGCAGSESLPGSIVGARDRSTG